MRHLEVEVRRVVVEEDALDAGARKKKSTLERQASLSPEEIDVRCGEVRRDSERLGKAGQGPRTVL